MVSSWKCLKSVIEIYPKSTKDNIERGYLSTSELVMALQVIKLDLSSIGLLGSTPFGKEDAELISKTILKSCKTVSYFVQEIECQTVVSEARLRTKILNFN